MTAAKGYWNAVTSMVWAYTLTMGFSAMDRLLIAMLFPFILPAFKLSFAQGGWLMTCMSLGYIVMSLVGGLLSDRHGRLKIVLPSTIVFSLGSAFTGLASSFAQLVAVRVLIGGAEGSFVSAAAAQIAEESPEADRGRNLGIFNSSFPFMASFIAPIFATQVAAAWGWQWACYLTFIPGFLLFLYINSRVRETKRFTDPRPRETDPSPASWIEILRDKNIWICCVVAGLWIIWPWCWMSFGVSYFVQRGFTPGDAGFIQSAIGAGGFVGMWLLPPLSDRVGRKPPILWGTLLGMGGMLILLYVPIASGIVLSAVAFLTSILVWGYGPFVMFVIPGESVPAGRAAIAVGVVCAFAEVCGAVIAPPLIGAVGDRYGLATAMRASLLCLVPVLLLQFALRETAPKVIPARLATLPSR